VSEAGDYTATNWVPTHDFKSARDTYADKVVNRSYSKATATRVASKDLVKPNIEINNPTVIVISDVTGSMGEWPKTMFSKLPYLMHEIKQYLGEQASFLVAAVGDATSDSYPLQIHEPKQTFDEAKVCLEGLVIEGGGGSQTKESYELAAGYFLHGVKVTEGQRPVLIFIGDEYPYSKLTASQLAVFDIHVEDMETKELFRKLNEVYNVFFIHKPYGNNAEGDTVRIGKVWKDLLPAEHVVYLADPNRVVDVIFGILAGATGKVDYFTKELTDRQTKVQVKTVLTSLAGLHKTTTISGKSTMHKLPSGKASKPLL
jgi:hypothetical protein